MGQIKGLRWLAPLACLICAVSSWGQTTESQGNEIKPSPSANVLKKSAEKEADSTSVSLAPRALFSNFTQDQRDIWAAPFKIRVDDLNWLVPAAGVTAGLFASDSELSSRISTTGFLARHSSTFSNAGVAALLGGSGGLYLMGRWKHDEHQKETGFLALEAAANGLLVTEGVKVFTARERPTDGTGQGRFFSAGRLSSSFPSSHAVAAWSAASVIAHEYPGPLTKLFVYGLATGVSLARVKGKDHFPSDVVVGSGLGWLIGRQVYTRHHDAFLPGAAASPLRPSSEAKTLWAESVASPYVPMDSWVYPAFNRLSALGIISSGILGLRPWTRRECARLVQEAEDSVDPASSSEVSNLYSALAKEFAAELGGDNKNYVGLDSLYARATSITGPPLTDGYHFGQTIVNDFGRPYQKGMNFVDGFSGSASIGMIGFYVRGEFEHAPSAGGFSQATINAIETADAKPLAQTASPIPAFNQFRLLDSYVALNIRGWQASFGKQTLWLGPSSDPFLWSDNAEPLYMFRLDQTSPQKLPGFLEKLGPYRIEFWVGKLTGQHFVNTQDGNISVTVGRSLERQPMVNGFKINFKPTPNFEFGVGKTGLWGGPRFPITLGSTRRSLFSVTNAGGRIDPGDRRSTVDFSYRIPGLRNWLVLYDDSFTEDEISPVGYPQQSAHNPGIYMPQLPKLPKLDFRFEAAYTNLQEFLQPLGGGFFYWNVRYLDGYTNKGNIIGNATVGRQGIAFRASSTYWFAPDKTIQAGYRTMEADRMFLQGGNLRDVDIRSEWSFHHGISLSSSLQYEWWNFPLLTNGNRQSNLAASVQLTYWPHWRWSGSH